MRLDQLLLIQGYCLLGLTFCLGAEGCEKVRDQDAAVGAADGGVDEAPAGRGGAAGKSAEPGSGGTSTAGTAGAGGRGAAGGKAGRGGSPASAGAGGAGHGAAGAGRGVGGAGSGAGGAAGARAGAGGSEAGSGGGQRCGTRGGVQCGGDQFCNFEPDPVCGATDRGGVCEDKPQVCADVFDPVCGCDSRTYGNDCEAHGAGVSVKRDGLCTPDECAAVGGREVYGDGATIPECESDEAGWPISGGREQVICCHKREVAGRTCGGIASLECDSGQFCNYEESAGGQGCDGTVSDAAGVCQSQPQGCTKEYQPVCGCDRKTYGNRCSANAAGMSVLHDGACTASDCKYLGGRIAYGLGPAPKCEAGETEHGSVVEDNGSIPIEGALCCLK